MSQGERLKKGQCVLGEGAGSLLPSISPVPLRQNLGLVRPARVGAASSRGPLSGPPRSWGSRHLQEKSSTCCISAGIRTPGLLFAQQALWAAEPSPQPVNGLLGVLSSVSSSRM